MTINELIKELQNLSESEKEKLICFITYSDMPSDEYIERVRFGDDGIIGIKLN